MAGRFPKGSYVRNSPDFFYRDLAVAVMAAGSTPAGFPQTHLFNDDQNGESLFVYGLACMTGSGALQATNVRIQYGNGFPAGSLGSPPQNVTLGDFLPSGQVTFVNDAAGFTGTVLAIIGASTGQFTTPGWPLFIVPPNFWLQFTGDTHNTFISVTVWYQVQRA